MTGTPVPASALTHQGQPGLARGTAGHQTTRVVSVLDNTIAITLTVPQRQLQYWQDTRGWVTASGKRRVYVGGDERAAALAATVTIPR
jgi:hypothetical protein